MLAETFSTTLEYLLSFSIVLGILIFIHEFGHFLVAKWLKIQVKVFSLGFGYRLVGFQWRDTDYRLSLIPLGGYVRLAGEQVDEHDPSDQNHFLSRPKYQRFLVFVMGAMFNIVLSLIFITMVYMIGIEVVTPLKGPPVVSNVMEGSPGEAADLHPGDKILEINGEPIQSFSDFMQSVFLSPNSTITLLIERDGNRMVKKIQVIPNPNSKYREGYTGILFRVPYIVGEVVPESPADKCGIIKGDRIIGIDGRIIDDSMELVRKIAESPGQVLHLMVERNGKILEKIVTPEDEGERGIIGVYFKLPSQMVKKDLPAAFAESLRFAYSNADLLFVILKKLIRGDLSIRVLSGPIEMASFARESYKSGMVYFIYFIGFVSLQLGIINLLPIPVLDGGHILILAFEGIIRRDLSHKVKEIMMQIGFIFLILLMVVIIYFDIIKKFFS